jgi:hypothetical protein
MSAILAIVSTLQKNRKSWAKTLLINSSRVAAFHKDEQSPLSKTIMYYRLNDQERGETWELQLNHAMNTVATRLMEDETNRLVKVQVLAYKEQGFAREKPTTANTEIQELCVDNIVYAYNLDNGTQSYCFINKGLNFVRLLLSHTVEDLSRAYSTSSSLSAS